MRRLLSLLMLLVAAVLLAATARAHEHFCFINMERPGDAPATYRWMHALQGTERHAGEVELPAGSLIRCRDVDINMDGIIQPNETGLGMDPAAIHESRWFYVVRLVADETGELQPTHYVRGSPGGFVCSLDINGDGPINAFELGQLRAQYFNQFPCHESLCSADFNGDGNVNARDLGLLKAGYGQVCPFSGPFQLVWSVGHDAPFDGWMSTLYVGWDWEEDKIPETPRAADITIELIDAPTSTIMRTVFRQIPEGRGFYNWNQDPLLHSTMFIGIEVVKVKLRRYYPTRIDERMIVNHCTSCPE